MKIYLQQLNQLVQFKVISQIIVGVLILVWASSSVIVLLLSSSYLKQVYKSDIIPPDFYGWTNSQRIRRAELSLDFLTNRQLLLDKYYLLNLTVSEIRHLQDVRNYVQVTYFVQSLSSLLLLAILLRLTWKRKLSTLTKIWKVTFVTTVGLLITLAILISLAWNYFFETFHQVLFAPGTWSFSASSTLIRLFPEIFWQLTAAAWLAGTLFLLLMGWLILTLLRKWLSQA